MCVCEREREIDRERDHVCVVCVHVLEGVPARQVDSLHGVIGRLSAEGGVRACMYVRACVRVCSLEG